MVSVAWRFLMVNGESISMNEAEKKYGVKASTIWARLNAGWSEQQAATKPTRIGYRKKHPLYRLWCNMLRRCSNERGRDYYRYGGRGIKVCDRWKNSFDLFVADMGERPPGTSLDRIDNDGNYEPENCRWADAFVQGNNCRTNRKLNINGETLGLEQAARKYGISAKRIWARLNKGWSEENAVLTPLLHNRHDSPYSTTRRTACSNARANA